jgi:hypothetical protein
MQRLKLFKEPPLNGLAIELIKEIAISSSWAFGVFWRMDISKFNQGVGVVRYAP